MKKYLIFSIIVFGVLASAYSQELRKVKNEAFKRGEKLKFRVYYQSLLTGKVTAGEATLQVKKEDKIIASRSTYHIVGIGRSKGAFNLFFKVMDRFETYIDEEAIIPWVFIRRTREGGYEKDDDVTFNQVTHVAVSRSATSKIPENVQDIISAFFYARTYDYSNAKVGDEFPIDFFLDDSIYTSKIVFEGKEVIETSLGKFNALRFKPMVVSGEVFSQEYPMTLWITDDKNHLPLIAESAVVIGSIKMELVKYSGLANPVTSKIE